MTKQYIWLLCAFSTACSTGFGKGPVPAPERVSCTGGLVQSQHELERYAGCTTIDGDLLVENVGSLAPLAQLEEVTGKLRVEHTRHLYSLAGLERVERVRELSLRDNRGLINGGALHGLLHAERAHIARNPRLSRAYGFEQGLLQSGAALELANNAGLDAEGMREFRSHAAGTTVAQR
jgi:hypothetical protein